MFIPKHWLKLYEEEMHIRDRAEMERLYAEEKSRHKAWKQEQALKDPTWAAKSAQWKQETRARHAAVVELLEQAIVDYVNRRYAAWRESQEDLLKNPYYSADDARRIFPEPNISMGHIVSNVDSLLRRHDIDDLKEQYSVVNAALRRLVKKGKLKTSIGSSGLIKGRKSETRLYEPGDKSAGGKKRHSLGALDAEVRGLLRK